jgi:hypothetical protein
MAQGHFEAIFCFFVMVIEANDENFLYKAVVELENNLQANNEY